MPGHKSEKSAHAKRATAQRRGVTVAQYAEHKGLPEEFLRSIGARDTKYLGRPAVAFEYYDAEGNVIAVRFRISLVGPEKFRWKKGAMPGLYGIDRLADASERGRKSVVLVEGESDAQSLWHAGFTALGLPGASMWREDRDAPAFENVETIYVVIEPDIGGEGLLRCLATSKIRDRARIVRLGPFKDVSQMFMDDPLQFKQRWRDARDKSIAWKDIDAEKDKQARLEAWKLCKDLASTDDVLKEFADALKRLGLVGERRNAKLLFLALVSRFFARPVSIAVKGPSSGGKSFLVETVLKFFPTDAWYALTAMSERALVYSKEDLSHRYLVVYEAAGMTGDFASYLIRTLLSEGRIRYETVVKGSDGPVASLVEREGPTGLLVTTTSTSLHPENETRLLSITVVDTHEQTASIMRSIAGGRCPNTDDFAQWHALQKWLSMKPHAVAVPFATALAELIPPINVRLRRDFRALLSLVEAHALLHQKSRDRNDKGVIVANVSDYAAVRRLAAEVVAQGLEATVTPTIRQTVEAVRALQTTDHGVSVSALAKHMKLDKSASSRRAKVAAQRGYVQNLEVRKGRAAQYTIGDPMPEEQEILPTPEAVEAAVAASSRLRGRP